MRMAQNKRNRKKFVTFKQTALRRRLFLLCIEGNKDTDEPRPRGVYPGGSKSLIGRSPAFNSGWDRWEDGAGTTLEVVIIKNKFKID